MGTEWHFPVMIAGALGEFVLLLLLVLGRVAFRRRIRAVIVVSLIVVVAGMLFGKYGLLLGLPWWFYYPVPALVTIALPPLVFRMTWRRTAVYLILAAISAPLIHVLFSFLLGWGEYMPFLPVPALASLLG
ncbi:MAG: hypothetical protein NTU93_04235 [Arthrobacter sp.]|nr:hypothetical protein [Arthrobacter sp.]